MNHQGAQAITLCNVERRRARREASVTHFLGTDFALSRGHSALCVRFPVPGAALARTVAYLDELNDAYAAGLARMKPHDIGIVVMPPGSGKTVLGCALIAERKASTLILVHRQPLLDRWPAGLQLFLAARCSHVIVDEGRRIPAAPFEGVIKTFKARSVLGLTATPYRKDGMERILLHQCEPVRYTSDVAGTSFGKTVFMRETHFGIPAEYGEMPAYQILAELIAHDEARNSVIAAAIVAACQGSPGVCIFATGSLVGEGFDLPVLDTLVLASPISFKGRVVQYTGRLHRESEGKTDVRIHDYLDASPPVMLKMYRKRRKEYEAMGYVIEKVPTSVRETDAAGADLFHESTR
ncbi:MAG: DEAD/DEAH box helicase [Candidatus Methylomirabilia bacterium]